MHVELEPATAIDQIRWKSSFDNRFQLAVDLHAKLMSRNLSDTRGNSFHNSIWHLELINGETFNSNADSLNSVGVVTYAKQESAQNSQLKCFASAVIPNILDLIKIETIRPIKQIYFELRNGNGGELDEPWDTSQRLLIDSISIVLA